MQHHCLEHNSRRVYIKVPMHTGRYAQRQNAVVFERAPAGHERAHHVLDVGRKKVKPSSIAEPQKGTPPIFSQNQFLSIHDTPTKIVWRRGLAQSKLYALSNINAGSRSPPPQQVLLVELGRGLYLFNHGEMAPYARGYFIRTDLNPTRVCGGRGTQGLCRRREALLRTGSTKTQSVHVGPKREQNGRLAEPGLLLFWPRLMAQEVGARFCLLGKLVRGRSSSAHRLSFSSG